MQSASAVANVSNLEGVWAMSEGKDESAAGSPAEALTDTELQDLRNILRERAHERWLRSRIKVLWPWVVGVVGAVVAIVDWIQRHLTFK